jgi:hypothetical protein
MVIVSQTEQTEHHILRIRRCPRVIGLVLRIWELDHVLDMSTTTGTPPLKKCLKKCLKSSLVVNGDTKV